MNRLKIQFLHDSNDCETCGGGYAEGMQATLDGHLILNLVPRAHCFGGDSWSERDAFLALLEKLGYPATIEGEP